MVRTRGRGYTLASLAEALGESVESVRRLGEEERGQLMVLMLKDKTRQLGGQLDSGEWPKVKQEARIRSKRRDNSVVSVKDKNEDICPSNIREGDDDVYSLLESSGGSEEYEPFPALRVREMSDSEEERREQGSILDTEEGKGMEQNSILIIGHCIAEEDTDHGCILDAEEKKAGEICKQDSNKDRKGSKGEEGREQNSEVKCGKRISVSTVQLDAQSLNGFILASEAWELVDEVDQNRNQERLLLDIESSDDEQVMREKASYTRYHSPEESSVMDHEDSSQARLKWNKERIKVDEEFCSWLLEIGRLDANIRNLTVSNIALEIEVSSSKKKHNEVKMQMDQMKSLLEPMQNKVMKLKLLLQSKEEKLREKDQVIQDMKEKLMALNAKATKEISEVLEEFKSKSRDQDASLKQIANMLQVRTTELELKGNEVIILNQKLEICDAKIQKLENDLAETEIAKLKKMMQHDMEFHEKNSELIHIQESLLKCERQKLQAEDECRIKTVELEDLIVKLNVGRTSMEKYKADLIEANNQIVINKTRLGDLEWKVEHMVKDINNQIKVGADITKDVTFKQGAVDSLESKLAGKEVELEQKIDILLKTTNENFAGDAKIKELSHNIRKQKLEHIEYCRQSSEEVQLLRCHIVQMSNTEDTLRNKVEEKTREAQEIYAEKESRNVIIDGLEQKNIALAAAEVRLVREVEEKTEEVKVLMEKLECNEAEVNHKLMLRSKSMKRKLVDSSEEDRKSPRLVEDTDGNPQLESLLSFSAPSPSSRACSGMKPSQAGVRTLTTLLDVELKAQREEREEQARNRLKHEVATCVKLCLKPFKPNVQKSGEPSVRKAWEVLTDKEFEELCRGQCLQSREEILEAWHQSSSPPESLVVSGRDQDRVQENINFFFAVRKEVSQALEGMEVPGESGYLPGLHQTTSELYTQFIKTHSSLSAKPSMGDMKLAIRGHLWSAAAASQPVTAMQCSSQPGP